MPRKVISIARASELTTIAESTWYDWASRGRQDVPQSFKLAGRRVLFEDEVLAWIEASVPTDGSGSAATPPVDPEHSNPKK